MTRNKLCLSRQGQLYERKLKTVSFVTIKTCPLDPKVLLRDSINYLADNRAFFSQNTLSYSTQFFTPKTGRKKTEKSRFLPPARERDCWRAWKTARVIITRQHAAMWCDVHASSATSARFPPFFVSLYMFSESGRLIVSCSGFLNRAKEGSLSFYRRHIVHWLIFRSFL